MRAGTSPLSANDVNDGPPAGKEKRRRGEDYEAWSREDLVENLRIKRARISVLDGKLRHFSRSIRVG